MSLAVKPMEARQIEARARAREKGVRVTAIVPGRHYQTRSQSDPAITYNLDRTSYGWTCECSGFRWSGCCKHVAQVQRRAEREGWTFGRIAKVAR